MKSYANTKKRVYRLSVIAILLQGVFQMSYASDLKGNNNSVAPESRNLPKKENNNGPVKLDFSFIQGGSAIAPESWDVINNKLIPGTYFLDVVFNNKNVVKRQLVITPEDKDSICFSAQWLQKAGVIISKEYFSSQYQKDRGCWVLSDAPGVTVDFDMASQMLKLSLPQAALSDTPDDIPWDYGNSALRINYTANASVSEVSADKFGSADLKANIGSWIVASTATVSDDRSEILLLNASRAIQSLKSDFTAGKTFVGDDLLGSVGIIGVSLKSNNSMQSGDLGYAPVFRGIARSAARVTLIQSGSTVYSEPVPAGPFAIRNVSLLNSGDVEMVVTEQNGAVSRQIFPLTVMNGMINSGQTEYSLSAGRRDSKENTFSSQGNVMSASAGYGFNFLTLRAGTLLHKQYQGVSAGVTTTLGSAGGVSLSGALSKAEYDDGENAEGAKVQATWNKTLQETSTGLFASASRRLSADFTDFSSFSPSRRERCYQDDNDNIWGLSSPGSAFVTHCKGGLNYVPQVKSIKNELNAGFSQPVKGLFNAGLSGWYRNYWNSDATENGLTVNVSTRVSSASLNLGGSLSQSQERNTRRNNWSASFSLSVPFSVFDRQLSSYTTVTTGKQGGAAVNSGVSGALNDRLFYSLGTGRNTDGSMQTNLSGSWTGNRAAVGMSLYQSRSGTTGSASMTGSVLAVPAAGSVIFSRTVSDTVAVANVGNLSGVKFSSGLDTTDSRGNVVIPLTGYRMNTVTVDSSTLPQTYEPEETSRNVVPSGGAVVYMPFGTVKVHRYLLQVRRAGGGFVQSGTWAKGRKGIPLGFVVQNGVLMINAAEHPGDVSLDGCVIPAGKIQENEKIQEVFCE